MSDTDIVERARKSVEWLAHNANGFSLIEWNRHSNNLLEAIAECERLRSTVRNDQEFDKIEKTYITEIERLHAGRAAVWAECRETCAKVCDRASAESAELEKLFMNMGQRDSSLQSRIVSQCLAGTASEIRALEVPNE